MFWMQSLSDAFLPAQEGDCTAKIEEKLSRYGVCALGAGTYCVSGVKMPDHSTLVGLGDCSRLVLAEDCEDGCCVSMGSHCTVERLYFDGLGEDGIPQELGTRHGLVFEGAATLQDWDKEIKYGIVRACRFRGFSGGGLTCRATGYDNRSSLNVSDCHATYCGAGINISYYSEYHRFTNVNCSHNFYGCVNNGGNNMFCNCGFTSNVTAFFMDNREGKSPNNSHGSAVCCTFNHSDNNKGEGIVALNTEHGFVFSGGQMFFSKIRLENARGVIVENFNFGHRQEITVKGGKGNGVRNCSFQDEPVFTVEDSLLRVKECYTRKGLEITL